MNTFYAKNYLHHKPKMFIDAPYCLATMDLKAGTYTDIGNMDPVDSWSRLMLSQKSSCNNLEQESDVLIEPRK